MENENQRRTIYPTSEPGTISSDASPRIPDLNLGDTSIGNPTIPPPYPVWNNYGTVNNYYKDSPKDSPNFLIKLKNIFTSKFLLLIILAAFLAGILMEAKYRLSSKLKIRSLSLPPQIEFEYK